MEKSKDSNLAIIYNILKDDYIDCDIPENELRDFAEDLYESVFDDDGDLNDILTMVYYFEEQMKAEGATIEVGKQCVIYEEILRGLDRNEATAKRLYDSFLSYQDLLAFSLLMDTYDCWLTKEERDNVLEIAKRSFIEFVWEDYV